MPAASRAQEILRLEIKGLQPSFNRILNRGVGDRVKWGSWIALYILCWLRQE